MYFLSYMYNVHLVDINIFTLQKCTHGHVLKQNLLL